MRYHEFIPNFLLLTTLSANPPTPHVIIFIFYYRYFHKRISGRKHRNFQLHFWCEIKSTTTCFRFYDCFVSLCISRDHAKTFLHFSHATKKVFSFFIWSLRHWNAWKFLCKQCREQFIKQCRHMDVNRAWSFLVSFSLPMMRKTSCGLKNKSMKIVMQPACTCFTFLFIFLWACLEIFLNRIWKRTRGFFFYIFVPSCYWKSSKLSVIFFSWFKLNINQNTKQCFKRLSKLPQIAQTMDKSFNGSGKFLCSILIAFYITSLNSFANWN